MLADRSGSTIRARYNTAPRPPPRSHVRQGRTDLMSLPYEQCRPSEPSSLRKWIKHDILTAKSTLGYQKLSVWKKIRCSSIHDNAYNQLSMRNNSFHPAESIQSRSAHPFLAANVCVSDGRALSRSSARGRLGEVSSRSKLRPANVFECGDPAQCAYRGE